MKTRAKTRDASELLSLCLGVETARLLAAEPERLLTLARRNMAVRRAAHDDGSIAPWLDRWQQLLDGPLEEVTRILTTDDEPSRAMRQNTPFAGAVPPSDRHKLVRQAREVAGRCAESSSST